MTAPRPLHVGLLEAGEVRERYLHVAGGYPEMFASLLGPVAPDIRWTRFAVRHGELPSSADACDAWLCTGSSASVYGGDAWIAGLEDFVRRLQAARKPYVGICFGHQLLASALGGEITRAPGGWGVGVHAMTLERTEPWMDPPLASCRLPYMHADQVVRLPEDTVVLARSEHCEVAMFRAGATMLGIEGHPEFPATYSEALLRDRVDRVGAARVDAALASLAMPTDSATVARWIARFLRGS